MSWLQIQCPFSDSFHTKLQINVFLNDDAMFMQCSLHFQPVHGAWYLLHRISRLSIHYSTYTSSYPLLVGSNSSVKFLRVDGRWRTLWRVMIICEARSDVMVASRIRHFFFQLRTFLELRAYAALMAHSPITEPLSRLFVLWWKEMSQWTKSMAMRLKRDGGKDGGWGASVAYLAMGCVWSVHTSDSF